MPLSATECGLSASLSVMLNVALIMPVVVGAQSNANRAMVPVRQGPATYWSVVVEKIVWL